MIQSLPQTLLQYFSILPHVLGLLSWQRTCEEHSMDCSTTSSGKCTAKCKDLVNMQACMGVRRRQLEFSGEALPSQYHGVRCQPRTSKDTGKVMLRYCGEHSSRVQGKSSCD